MQGRPHLGPCLTIFPSLLFQDFHWWLALVFQFWFRLQTTAPCFTKKETKRASAVWRGMTLKSTSFLTKRCLGLGRQRSKYQPHFSASNVKSSEWPWGKPRACKKQLEHFSKFKLNFRPRGSSASPLFYWEEPIERLHLAFFSFFSFSIETPLLSGARALNTFFFCFHPNQAKPSKRRKIRYMTDNEWYQIFLS